MSLAGKKIVLGVSGGIAAYKTPELVRRLRDRGADVRVAMTEAAKAFITPLSLQAVSGYPVSDSLLDPAAEAAMGHIELGKWADLVILAPATADLIARVAAGGEHGYRRRCSQTNRRYQVIRHSGCNTGN